MEFILDIIFELLFEGAAEASASPRVPKAVRIILIILLASFYFGLTGFCLYLAVREQSLIAGVIGVFILIMTILAARKTYSHNRQ